MNQDSGWTLTKGFDQERIRIVDERGHFMSDGLSRLNSTYRSYKTTNENDRQSKQGMGKRLEWWEKW